MKKIIITTIALFLALPLTVWAVTAFNSKQVGDTPVDGYILQTNGEISTWVATSSLGIIGTSQWTTNGSSIYYNTGNVGIGTTTPISKLTVDGNTEITGNITLPNSTSTITLGNFSNISALFDMALGMNVDTSVISGMDFKNSNSSGQVRLLARNNQNDYLSMNILGSGSGTTLFRSDGCECGKCFLECIHGF
jgi:hypothetical protein